MRMQTIDRFMINKIFPEASAKRVVNRRNNYAVQTVLFLYICVPLKTFLNGICAAATSL